MRFELYTLVDIENTQARKDAGFLLYSKEQNYLSVLNTISMRANPTIVKPPALIGKFPKFGSAFKDAKKVWHMIFEIEYGIHNVDMLTNDFNLVPFIDRLDNDARFENPIFSTDSTKNKNIIFEQMDKYY